MADGVHRGRWHASAAELEELLVERRAAESLLAAQLLREREALAAARLYADGGVAAGAFSDGGRSCSGSASACRVYSGASSGG
jgi:hypothetical protein